MKTVIVTGSSKGLGKSTIIEFAKLGYNVVINYNNSKNEALALEKEIKEKYQVDTLVVKCDISKEEEIIDMINTIIDKFKTIDVLVNNASICCDNVFELKDKFNFMKILEINLVGTFLVSKHVGKIMLNNQEGKIINISSTNGIDTYYPESLDYDASKAGIISLTHNLAKEYAPYINVNCICPGWIETDMNKQISPDFKKQEETKILLGHFAKPEEIAKVITFLASSDANYINNSIIRVDGGKNE